MPVNLKEITKTSLRLNYRPFEICLNKISSSACFLLLIFDLDNHHFAICNKDTSRFATVLFAYTTAVYSAALKTLQRVIAQRLFLQVLKDSR